MGSKTGKKWLRLLPPVLTRLLWLQKQTVYHLVAFMGLTFIDLTMSCLDMNFGLFVHTRRRDYCLTGEDKGVFDVERIKFVSLIPNILKIYVLMSLISSYLCLSW